MERGERKRLKNKSTFPFISKPEDPSSQNWWVDALCDGQGKHLPDGVCCELWHGILEANPCGCIDGGGKRCEAKKWSKKKATENTTQIRRAIFPHSPSMAAPETWSGLCWRREWWMKGLRGVFSMPCFFLRAIQSSM